MSRNLIVNIFVGAILSSIARKRNLKESFIYFIIALINPVFAGFALFARLFYISRAEQFLSSQNKKENSNLSDEDNMEEYEPDEEEEHQMSYKEVEADELSDILHERSHKWVEGSAQNILRDGFDYDGRDFITKEEKINLIEKNKENISLNDEIAKKYLKKLEKKKEKEYFVAELIDKNAEYIAGKAKFESGKERKLLMDMLLSKKYYLDKVERRFEAFEEEALKREFEIFNDIDAEIEYIRRKEVKSS
jgi:hypothetical protein